MSPVVADQVRRVSVDALRRLDDALTRIEAVVCPRRVPEQPRR